MSNHGLQNLAKTCTEILASWIYSIRVILLGKPVV